MKSLIGQLLAANPLNPRDNLNRSVILIVTHTDEVSLGLQLNRQLLDMDLASVGEQVGITLPLDDPLYFGGPMTANKIHMVHSSDWQGLTTIRINSEISVTNDISVLAALSRGDGPEYYRACAGFWSWQAGQLESQLAGHKDSLHRWELAPADLKSVFESGWASDQWQAALAASARLQIDSWFNPVRD